MATQLEWTAYNTPDTAIAGATLNALTNTSFALGAAIDNTAALYTDADLTIGLSSSVTSGAGTPTVIVWLLPAIDGTNYPTPPGSGAAAAPPSLIVGTIVTVPSVTTQFLALRGIIIPPSLFKIMIQSNLGVTLPSTNTSTCQLWRYRLQGV